MIVLDTNVLSELMRDQPSTIVQGWISGFDLGDLYTTSITKAELLAGIAMLPAGRRRQTLDRAANDVLDTYLSGRILAFEGDAPAHYAEIVGRKGRMALTFDTLIAAIARCRGFAVATRNIGHFVGCGVPLHDPWAG